MKTLLILILIPFFSFSLYAQEKGGNYPYGSEGFSLKDDGFPVFEISTGLGIGHAYGILGGNIEYNIKDYIGIFAGVGVFNMPVPNYDYNQYNDFSLPLSRVNVTFGIRAYPLPRAFFFKPRFSLSYGLNGSLNYNIVERHAGLVLGQFGFPTQGLSAGLGLKFMFGKEEHWGMDFDLSYALTQKAWIAKSWTSYYIVDEIYPATGSNLTASLGFRYEFNL